MPRISKQECDDLPETIRRRYERDLDGDQIAILQTKIPIDVLLDTNPDWLIQSMDQVENIEPEELGTLLEFLSDVNGGVKLVHVGGGDRLAIPV